MKTLTDQISQWLNDNKHYSWVVQSNHFEHHASQSLIDYYNPARPSLIQVFSECELNYFNQLSRYAQWQEIDRLAEYHTQFVVISDNLPTPDVLSQQTVISTSSTKHNSRTVIRQVEKNFASEFYPSEIVQGGMLVINNQGILITGNSGAGKSQLLLSLLDRGHLWISDELTHCYSANNGAVFGKAVEDLSAFSHVKHIGPINIDKTFGLSKRLPSAPLAGIIHLGENDKLNNRAAFLYEQKFNKSILGQQFPAWYINPAVNNLEVMIETCTKQLILALWGQHAASELEQELKNTLCETV